jgi:hypothetical protein
MSGRSMLLLGFVLVVLGAVLPLLMVLRTIQPSLFLSFFSFSASVAGLGLGLVGTVYYGRRRKGGGR